MTGQPMVVAPNVGQLPERQIIRDLIASQLVAKGYMISNDGMYIIRLSPCGVRIANKTYQELANIPSFNIFFEDAAVVLQAMRATSIRTIVSIEYADPMMLEKLASALSNLGICLPI